MLIYSWEGLLSRGGDYRYRVMAQDLAQLDNTINNTSNNDKNNNDTSSNNSISNTDDSSSGTCQGWLRAKLLCIDK